MTSRRWMLQVVGLALSAAAVGVSHRAVAQPRAAADPAALFAAFEGTWVYVVKTTARGEPGRSVGLVTFTRTGPTALTFTAASRSATRSPEHQGFAYAPEFGKLWWDAQRGKVARQEGKDGAVEYIDLIDLGYVWTETLADGLPSRGIREPLTLTARMEVVRSNGTLRWVAEGRNAKGERLYTGDTVFTRVQE